MNNIDGDSLVNYLGRIMTESVCGEIGEEKMAAVEKGVNKGIEEFVRDYGGTSLYVPNGSHIKSTNEKKAIIAEFKGNNLRELAKKYGKSDMRIRQIVNEDRKSRSANGSR